MHFCRVFRKFDKMANSTSLRLILQGHGEKTESTPKFVWSLAALSPKRSEVDAGGSSRGDGHPQDDSDNLGENWRHAGAQGDISTGEGISSFDSKASSH
jgi:hypothetical protein